MSLINIFTKIPQISKDIKILREKPPIDLGVKPERNSRKWHASFRLLFSALITLLGFGAGFYLLLSKETSDDTKKFGAGLIGLAVGHWLS